MKHPLFQLTIIVALFAVPGFAQSREVVVVPASVGTHEPLKATIANLDTEPAPYIPPDHVFVEVTPQPGYPAYYVPGWVAVTVATVEGQGYNHTYRSVTIIRHRRAR